MTDASPWRREIGAHAGQGFREIDFAYGRDLDTAMRALARGVPAGASLELHGKLDSWLYAAITEAPGPRYVLGRGALSAQSWALVEQPGGAGPRAFALPRWSEPPRIWIVSPDLPAFVRTNIDLYGMAQEANGGWILSAHALTALSGVPRSATLETDQIEFALPTFLLDAGPQRFSFRLRSQTPIRTLLLRAVCGGVDAPITLEAEGERDAVVAIAIAEPARPNAPTRCILTLNGAQRVSTNSERGATLTLVAPARLERVR
jgi:hypothetical protein